MKKIAWMLSLLFIQITLIAQDKSDRPSPPATSSANILGNTVSIDYSQPSVKGREIFGKLVPFGQVWRAGANETTSFTTSADANIEGHMLPAGKYALFMIPNEKQWTIIFNKTIKWGAFSYKEEEDVLRVNVYAKKSAKFAEKLTYQINDKGMVSLEWENTTVQFHINFNPEYNVVNRSIEKVKLGGKEVLRFSENAGQGIAWLMGKEFGSGSIEFDAKGRDVLQGSFIGVAFHGVNDTTFEVVYFRPFNFQATDPERHVHAVQYCFEPNLPWHELRNTRNGEFEAAIIPQNVKPEDWFHAKIEVKNGRIKVFVNDSKQPCLDVPSLNPTGKSGKIGFWVGNNSNGDFANLKINNL
ncbi:MAG: DUF2911 domain-containing protein [Saprospiraceae bacterium]|nr:DUF2911 domain-containing protein [Saprospiraceae bacterium]